jgi:hypothetical protein
MMKLVESPVLYLQDTQAIMKKLAQAGKGVYNKTMQVAAGRSND